MTTLGPRAAHQPPLAAPSTPNLLSSVSPEPRASQGRWTHGIEYRPNRYNTGGSVDPCGDVGEGIKTTTVGPALVSWDPYILWTEDRCSTLTMNADEIEAFARADLETQTSHKLEAILWTNLVDGTDFGTSHPNIGLASATASEPNYPLSFPPVKAFSDMIDALASALGGARGMIHVEKRMLPYLAFYGLAVQNGQRLVTTLGDHVVVPGTGYPGTDPEGNEPGAFHTVIYGTSMVEVLLAPVDVFTDLSSSIDRENNLVEYRAERMALAHWDHGAHIAIGVCLEDPAGDCSDAGS